MTGRIDRAKASLLSHSNWRSKGQQLQVEAALKLTLVAAAAAVVVDVLLAAPGQDCCWVLRFNELQKLVSVDNFVAG